MRDRRKNAQFLRHLIYDTKRDYGFPIIIVKTISIDMDIENGIKRPTLSYRKVQRAIFLPTRMTRSFIYDLAYTAANKNFTEGAFIDSNDVTIFLDYRDTVDFVVEIDDRIIYDGDEYTVVNVQDFIKHIIYGVKMRHVVGQILDDPSTTTVIEIITVTDSTVGVKT